MGRRRVARVLAMLVVVAAAGCWPQSGAGQGKTNHNPFESALTIDNVASLQEAWRAPGVLHAVVGNRVIGTTSQFEPSGRPIEVTARNPATGAVTWSQRLGDAGANQSVLEAPPVGVGDEVWVGWATATPDGEGWACQAGYDRIDVATGTPRREATGRYPQVLVPYGDRVAGYWATRASDGCPAPQSEPLSVVDAETVSPVWAADSGVIDAVAVAGDRLVAAGGALRAWDTTACESDPDCPPVWTVPDLGQVVHMAAMGDDLLVAVNGEPGEPQRLLTFDLATGARRAEVALADWPVSLATDGTLAFVTVADTLTAYDLASCRAGACTVTWSADAPQASSNLAVAGGVVYTGSVDGILAFPAAGCGAPTCPATASLQVTGSVGSLAVSGGRLFAQAGSDVVALAPTTST